MATEVKAPYNNMTSMNPPGGGGPASLTQVTFYIKASKATNIRVNFYNPVFDPKNPAGACGTWANQYDIPLRNHFLAENHHQPLSNQLSGLGRNGKLQCDLFGCSL